MKASDLKVGMKVKLVKHTYDDGSFKGKEEVDCGEVLWFDRYGSTWCRNQGVRVNVKEFSHFVSADMIEPFEEKEETVEYNGKRYNKKAFEAAIEQLCIEE